MYHWRYVDLLKCFKVRLCFKAYDYFITLHFYEEKKIHLQQSAVLDLFR